MKKKLLFICTANLQRSPTAEDLFRDSKKYEAKSAGIHLLAVNTVSQELVDWADIIFVMNERKDRHLTYLADHFKLGGKEIHDLDIPDTFPKDDPNLIKLLKQKLAEYLEM